MLTISVNTQSSNSSKNNVENKENAKTIIHSHETFHEEKYDMYRTSKINVKYYLKNCFFSRR